MKHIFIALAATLSIATYAHTRIPPGEYLMELGEGLLVIKPDRTFSLTTFGRDASTCDFSGAISKEPSQIEDSVCFISFKRKGHNVLVDMNNRYTNDQDTGCSSFCGYRAGYGGGTFYAASDCGRKSMAQTRNRFKVSYDKKDYPKAIATLSPLLEKCARFLAWPEESSIRNDLALAQLHIGNKAACLATLKPLAEDASQSEEEIRERYPPLELNIFLPLIKATRTKLRLCRAQ